jgi:hypothetical protein
MLTTPSATDADINGIKNYLAPLDEDTLRKIVYSIFYTYLSDGDIQDYHGQGEHGLDLVGSVSEKWDPFGKKEVYLIQIKCGRLSLPKWRKDLSGQLAEAFCSITLPRNANKGNPRRLIIILNGQLKPGTFDAIRNWNERIPIPIEVLDITGLAKLFVEKYGLTLDTIKKIHGGQP